MNSLFRIFFLALVLAVFFFIYRNLLEKTPDHQNDPQVHSSVDQSETSIKKINPENSKTENDDRQNGSETNPKVATSNSQPALVENGHLVQNSEDLDSKVDDWFFKSNIKLDLSDESRSKSVFWRLHRQVHTKLLDLKSNDEISIHFRDSPLEQVVMNSKTGSYLFQKQKLVKTENSSLLERDTFCVLKLLNPGNQFRQNDDFFVFLWEMFQD